MRTEKEMFDLILGIAKEDERIRSVIMCGSRANEDCPKDMYQDYDICYYVTDVKPFFNNMEWIEEKFGTPAVFTACSLFEKLAKEVAGHFGYTYNQLEAYNMTRYLKSVRRNAN